MVNECINITHQYFCPNTPKAYISPDYDTLRNVKFNSKGKAPSIPEENAHLMHQRLNRLQLKFQKIKILHCIRSAYKFSKL